jgi:hypothetical protein
MKNFEPQQINTNTKTSKLKIEQSSKGKQVFLEVGDLSTYNSLSEGGEKEDE